MNKMREGIEREEMTEREREILSTAFLKGLSKISPRVTLRPIVIPRWVAESRRGRSGQGQLERSERSLASEESGPEEITQLLSLLIPRPERWEKWLIRERAGEIRLTREAARARSSAKAKVLTPSRRESAVRRGS